MEQLVTGDCGFSVQCRERPYENLFEVSCFEESALKCPLIQKVLILTGFGNKTLGFL